MKQIRILSAALVFAMASLSLVSCKKESTPPKTTQDKLFGKWNLISEVTDDYYGGASHITTLNYQPGDYIEFKKDWTAIKYQNGSITTYNYSVIYYTKILLEGTGFCDLKVLTESDLELYKKEITGSAYKETTILLKK